MHLSPELCNIFMKLFTFLVKFARNDDGNTNVDGGVVEVEKFLVTAHNQNRAANALRSPWWCLDKPITTLLWQIRSYALFALLEEDRKEQQLR